MPVATKQAVEEAFGVPLIELSGMTEIAGLGATFLLSGRHVHGSISSALPDCELRVADAEDAARTLPRGEVGELMVRGPIVMVGYYGDKAKTREPDGWLHTGDLASIDEDGCVFIVDMILTGGYNVYPAEIERVLAAHPPVALVAVGRQPDRVKGEIAKAYVVLKKGAPCDEVELIEFCRTSLAAYKCPRSVQFAGDVPQDEHRQDHASAAPHPRRRRNGPGLIKVPDVKLQRCVPRWRGSGAPRRFGLDPCVL
jgi:long-chain acyl-CoA synthetase